MFNVCFGLVLCFGLFSFWFSVGCVWLSVVLYCLLWLCMGFCLVFFECSALFGVGVWLSVCFGLVFFCVSVGCCLVFGCGLVSLFGFGLVLIVLVWCLVRVECRLLV